MDKELQRAITLTELAPRPYFSITNVHLVDINMFAKFYEILSLSFQDIEKPKCQTTNRVCGGIIRDTDIVEGSQILHLALIQIHILFY